MFKSASSSSESAFSGVSSFLCCPEKLQLLLPRSLRPAPWLSVTELQYPKENKDGTKWTGMEVDVETHPTKLKTLINFSKAYPKKLRVIVPRVCDKVIAALRKGSKGGNNLPFGILTISIQILKGILENWGNNDLSAISIFDFTLLKTLRELLTYPWETDANDKHAYLLILTLGLLHSYLTVTLRSGTQFALTNFDRVLSAVGPHLKDILDKEVVRENKGLPNRRTLSSSFSSSESKETATNEEFTLLAVESKKAIATPRIETKTIDNTEGKKRRRNNG